MTLTSFRTSGILDNHHCRSIGNFLKEKILHGSDLSFTSAYFTIYIHPAFKNQLDHINRLRCLFGEPQFIKSLDPDKTEKKAFGEFMSKTNCLKECERIEWILATEGGHS